MSDPVPIYVIEFLEAFSRLTATVSEQAHLAAEGARHLTIEATDTLTTTDSVSVIARPAVIAGTTSIPTPGVLAEQNAPALSPGQITKVRNWLLATGAYVIHNMAAEPLGNLGNATLSEITELATAVIEYLGNLS